MKSKEKILVVIFIIAVIIFGVWKSVKTINKPKLENSKVENKNDELKAIDSADDSGKSIADELIEQKKKLKEQEENCESSGGDWSISFLNKMGICNMPTTDAGKECLDDKECDGACIAKSAGVTKGKCSDWTVILGCRYYMENGKAVESCRD